MGLGTELTPLLMYIDYIEIQHLSNESFCDVLKTKKRYIQLILLLHYVIGNILTTPDHQHSTPPNITLPAYKPI